MYVNGRLHLAEVHKHFCKKRAAAQLAACLIRGVQRVICTVACREIVSFYLNLVLQV